MSVIRRIDDDSVEQATEIIHRGGLVGIPTDTVYGVVCDPCNAEAINRIYELKSRPRYKPLQVLLSSIDELDQLGLDLPVPLNRLAATFLPGAFSPIAIAREDCPLKTVYATSTGARTQGIRIPNSAPLLRVLRATGPVAASSANASGEESAQTVEESVSAFGDAVELYLDGGPAPGHVSSTVVAANPLARDGIDIVREGIIPESVIRRALHINGGGLGA